jgi:hypothetical protein
MLSTLTTRFSRASMVLALGALVYFAGALLPSQVGNAQTCPCFTEPEIMAFCMAGKRRGCHDFNEADKGTQPYYKKLLVCSLGVNTRPSTMYTTGYSHFIWGYSKKAKKYTWGYAAKQGKCLKRLSLPNNKTDWKGLVARSDLTPGMFRACSKIIQSASKRLATKHCGGKW